MFPLRSTSIHALLLAALVAACADDKDAVVAPEPSFAVTGIDPASGTINGGTDVAVVGTGFREGSTVTFGGLPALRVRFINARVLAAVAPAHGPGDVEVVVTNPQGISTSPRARYRYIDETQGPGPWDY